jgi:TP901 family phage tail tape measure protein
MAKILVEIDVDDKGNVALKQLVENTKKVKQVTASTGDVLKKVFASSEMLKAVQLLKLGLREMGDEAIKFNKAMKGIEAIGGVSSKKILGQFSDQARNLAIETEFSASAVANAMLELNKAGVQGTDAMKVMPDMLNLATTAQTELAWATSESMAVLRAFNLEVSELDRVVNVVASGLNMSALDTENFMDAMRHVAPVAGAMNVSIEETTAMLAALSDAGIKGSLAGTSLKNILTNLMKPAPAVAGALKEMGVKGKTLTDILAGLRDRGLNVLDFLETFDKRAVVGSTLLAQQREKLIKLTTAFEEQKAKVSQVSDVMRDAYNLRLLNIKNILNEIGLSILDAFGVKTETAMAGVADVLKTINVYIDTNNGKIRDFIEGITDLAKVLSELGSSILPLVETHFKEIFSTIGELGRLTSNISGLVEKFAAFNPITEELANLTKMVLDNMSGIGRLSKVFKSVNILFDKSAGRSSVKINDKLLGDKDFLVQAERAVKLNKEIEDLKKSLSNLSKMDWNTKFYSPKEVFSYFKSVNPEREALEKDLKAVEKAFKETMQSIKGEFTLDELKEYTKLSKMMKDLADFEEKKTPPVVAPKKPISGLDLPIEVKPKKVLSPDELKYWLKYVNDQDFGGGNRRQLEFIKKKNVNMTKNAEEDIRLQEQIAKLTEEMNNPWYARKEMIEQYGQMSIDIYSSSIDLIDSFEQAAHEKRMARFDAEAEKLDADKDREMALAGQSEFRKEMLEQKYTKKKIELDKKIEAEREKQAKREKQRTAVLAIATSFLAALDAMARERTGAIGKLVAYGTVLAAGLTGAAAVADLALRDGSSVDSRVYRGQGNSTSDSMVARVSAGETVLSKRDTDKLGGESGIAAMLDRGSSYSSGGSNYYIETFVGQKTWVREMVKLMDKERNR